MKKFFSVVICIVLVLLLVRCFDGSDKKKESDESISQSTQTMSPDYNYEDLHTPYIPVISSLDQLSKYLNSQKEADIFEFSFQYNGYETFSGQTMAQMCNACNINLSQNGDVYSIKITEYPGDRIVDAWYSGDYSTLTADEFQALNTALGMIESARSQAYDEYELELLLHDMLMERITYYTGSLEVNDPLNPPRYLTVIGALLDGKANCQGYADAFYTLASLAGFTVGRISVECPDDFHMANTINLNGLWYIVDVTYDDMDGDGENIYGYFNVGKDMVTEYWWASYMEYHPITQYSDNNFYYVHYSNIHYDMQTMADAIAWQWSQTGAKTIRTMLVYDNQAANFDSYLYSSLMKTGRAFNYTNWYYYTDRDSYYTVIFN